MNAYAEERGAGFADADQPRGALNDRAIRCVDVTLTVMVLIFLAPLMIVIAAFVYLADPGPVIFAHRRVGQGGRYFLCFKFRSMAQDADARLVALLARDPQARAEWDRDHKLRNDPRIVGIGGFLRKSSLDELPQLFNVLRGEMSLVGPRPIVEAEVPRYGRYIAHYCAVPPGITGLWQIGGRNDTSYRRRVAYDIHYQKSRSAVLNMKILLLTVPSVVKAQGSY